LSVSSATYMAPGRWPHARAPAARPCASGPSAAVVVGHVRRPVRLIPLRMTAVEKLPLTSTPHAISLHPLPCRPLPSSAVRTSLVPALYAPPPASYSPPRAPPHPGYLTDLSILANEGPSDPSPEPYLPPSSPPPRAHTSEHPSVQNPKLGPPSSRACFRAASYPAPDVDRRDLTGEPPVPRGGGKRLPCFSLRPKGPIGWAGKAVAKWAWPIPTVPFHVFHLELIQNSFQFSLNF
jgi:hypothetical protein